MAEPQIYMLFCEDTRDEVGNKISLMGLLGPKISMDGTEALKGRMKGLTAGALCRFFESKPKQAEFEVRFIAASDEFEVPSPPKVMRVPLHPSDNETSWTCNIVGHFNNLPIHVGMRVESYLRVDGKEYSASLEVEAASD